MTPMRSSLDCWRRATASWSCWIWVCSCTMSLLTAKAGEGQKRTAARRATEASRMGFADEMAFDCRVERVDLLNLYHLDHRRRRLAFLLAVQPPHGANARGLGWCEVRNYVTALLV